MRAEDLDHGELLELDAESGVIRFAGQRALLLDAVAMGLLRKYLVENFGINAARTVLTQFGFAHGWRMAEAIHAEFEWENGAEWARAGARPHALVGLFRVQAGPEGPLSKLGAMILASYEAEQHLLHFGRADTSVCWTICGLISGYLSRSIGKDICVLENRCLCKGDASCHMFARTREEWGDDRADELTFFEPRRLEECLDVSLHRVMATLKDAEHKLTEHRRALRRVAREVDEPFGVIAKSPAMRASVELARRVAKVDSTVLITGESGSGKERVARLLHDESTRAAGPFVAINCGAIAESLLESELFGHARGAFTGASQDRPGLFEAAQGGSLLLDEVGEVSAAMQVKLLRALQEREIRRVGENKNRRFDVRVIAATNRDLLESVASGVFRQDLYYRLKVIELHVPPLRERRDDILPLARVLLADAAMRMKRELEGLTPAVADQLLRYPWPGNVRELQNAMERAAALAQGNRVEIEDLPEELRVVLPLPLVAQEQVRPLADIEKDYILSALQLNRGNQTHTAAQLGIGTATLYRKLKRYNLKDG
ncbi:sigma-54-dependent Fis family transcriptional regulator [Enhygromyxa salina]|uniref:Transcriptional regulatory protein ZraR n=1 Tax=Enhygromyxa salina TaxID=215803 RepID=A0A2S9YV38_9BACT|nr:sigma-54-dependent Fis family transcriptional regulator [Enhygromyxa salina]PRQ08950.1 Transcriptional regulatory protein ZraR [Enhygromyxa salina]